MKLWLFREASGFFGLSRLKPILAKIIGTNTKTYYVPAGDPVGFRHMCAGATASLTGGSIPMEPVSEPARIECFIIRSDRVTQELRQMIRAAQSELTQKPEEGDDTKMYDIVISAVVAGSTVTGLASVTKNGKPFVSYTAEYFNLEAPLIAALAEHVEDFKRKNRLTGLTREQMQNVQKRFANHMFALGDKIGKGKK